MKAVFFDIDGTFLDHQTGKVLPSTWKACELLRANGYKVALCTGRPKALAQKFDEFIFDGFIGSTGAYVENHKGEVVLEDCFDDVTVDTIFKIAKDKDVFIQCLSDDSFISKVPDQRILEVYDTFHLNVPSLKPYDGRKLMNINMFGEPEWLIETFQSVPNVRMFKTSNYTVDFAKPTVSKATAIAHLMRYWGYNDIHDYVAFGDSMNDIEMLSQAKIGVAMKNSDPDVFPYADELCGPSNEDSIYQMLQKLQMIPR